MINTYNRNSERPFLLLLTTDKTTKIFAHENN